MHYIVNESLGRDFDNGHYRSSKKKEKILTFDTLKSNYKKFQKRN